MTRMIVETTDLTKPERNDGLGGTFSVALVMLGEYKGQWHPTMAYDTVCSFGVVLTWLGRREVLPNSMLLQRVILSMRLSHHNK